ncbi:MAG: hypothetical protein KAJ18_00425 [Candidatus Omnitrophica bacterium]|nr:hypothetical protein [Candidatus Omnitrophota bacterium]
MVCPMFIDNRRECLLKIHFLPTYTLPYCETERHEECPFFKTINKIGNQCDCVDKCALYKHFGAGDFRKFEQLTSDYCLSDNNVNCARFKLNKSGGTVSSTLLPDGGELDV